MLVGLLFMYNPFTSAQDFVKNSIVAENFETAEAPWGFTAPANLTTTIATAKTPVSGNVLQWFFNNAGGSRTATKNFNGGANLNIPTDGIVKLSFNWHLGVPTNRNTSGIFLRFRDADGNISIAFSTESTQGATGNAFHYVNLDNTVTNSATAETTRIVPTGGSIFRDSWVSVYASLNFNTKVVDTLIVTNGTASYTNYGQAFYSNSAAGISSLELFANRDGSNMTWTGQLDNFEIFNYEEVSEMADVTINYLDQNDDIAKTARVATGKPVGLTYAATTDDKLSFSANGNYYAFDAANTVADQIIVAEGGSVINLKFKKTVLTTGTYNWTGLTNSDWNEIDNNFTTDNTNAIAYQNGNAIAFGNSGTQKAVVLTGKLNTNDQDILVTDDGYSFIGAGMLAGSGAFIANITSEQTLSLNIINEMTGGVVVNGGTATILKDAAARRLTLANGASVNLSTGAAFSKAISGTGTISLIPTSNVTYSSAITGAEQVNYSLASAGAVTAAGVFSAMPILNNTFSGSINVSTTLSETAMFGSTNSFADNKLTLGNNVGLVYPINPASDGTTTVAIGELTGSASSKIMGPRLRNVNYNVGSLGTNSVFEGTIQNFAADQWSNIPVINFAKSGAGELTMSGESTQYIAGAIAVNAGSLKVTGILGSATVPVTVANGATLKGTGTIGGATTINGTLMGNLNFGSNLTLTNNVELTITGFTEGEYDVIDVAGTLTNGGTLKVTSSATAPANNTSIQLLKAGTYSGQFAVKDLPEHYSFDEATGYLTYNNLLSALEQNNNLRIYPALTRGEIFVTGAEVLMVEVCNMTGNVLHKTNGNTTSNVINISNLSSGAYILRVTLANGETKIQKVLLNK